MEDDGSLSLRIERVSRTWRSNLKRALIGSDFVAYDNVKNLVSQLAEWRHQKAKLDAAIQGATTSLGSTTDDSMVTEDSIPQNSSASGSAASSSVKLAAAVNESILNLIESTTASRLVRDGLVLPRTDADEPAHEGNSGVISLLRMHVDSEKRMQRISRVPSAASEAIAADVARGLHGGPSVSNERATDVSGLSSLGDSARESNVVSKEQASSPLESVAAGIAFLHTPEPHHGLLQIMIDIQCFRALSGLGQPAEIRICVWDGLSHNFISEESVLSVDPTGRPSLFNGGSLSISNVRKYDENVWSQAVFVNVPRSLVAHGKCYITFRLFRKGPLKDDQSLYDGDKDNNDDDDGGDGESDDISFRVSNVKGSRRGQLGGKLSTVNEVNDDEGSAMTTSVSSSLFSRNPEPRSKALYFRPVGVAIMHVPVVLTRLADGTPHVSKDPIFFMRPSKADDTRFFGLHRFLIAERERDIEQEERLRGESLPDLKSFSPSSESSNSSSSNTTTASTLPNQQHLLRCARLHNLPVVVRCFSTLILPMLTDSRYSHLLYGGAVRVAQKSCSQPLSRAWRPHAFSTYPTAPNTLPRPGTSAVRRSSLVGVSRPSIEIPSITCFDDNNSNNVEVSSPALSGINLLKSTGSEGAAARTLAGLSQQSSHDLHTATTSLLFRDVLHVTLKTGVFGQDQKLSPRNVQIRVSVLTHKGEVLPCFVTREATASTFGEKTTPPPLPPLGEYRSAVYYHCNNPTFDETISINIPSAEQFESSHIRFEIWHASSTEDKNHQISFAFLPLSDVTGTTIRDGSHTLRCFRPIQRQISSTPWYLVAPVCDGAGLEVMAAAPLPFSQRSLLFPVEETYLNSRANPDEGVRVRSASIDSSGLKSGFSLSGNIKSQRQVLPVLTVEHVRASSNRHIPASALPSPLSEAIDTIAGTQVNAAAFVSSATTSTVPVVNTNSTVLDRSSRVNTLLGPRPVSVSFSDILPPPKPVHNSSNSFRSLSASVVAGAVPLPGAKASGTLNRNRPVGATTPYQIATNLPSEGSIDRHRSGSVLNFNLGSPGTGASGRSQNAAELQAIEDQKATLQDAALISSVLRPLILRDDVFEIETRLVSDAKTSVSEIQTLQRWKVVSQASLFSAINSLMKLTAKPYVLIRVFPELLTSLLGVLSSYSLRPGKTQFDERIISSGITLLVVLIECLFCKFRAPLNPGKQSCSLADTDIEDTDEFSSEISRMSRPNVDSYVEANLFETYMRTSFFFPDLHFALMPALLYMVRGIAAAPIDADENSVAPVISQDDSIGAVARPYFSISYRTAIRALCSMELLFQLATHSIVKCGPQDPSVISCFRAQTRAILDGMIDILRRPSDTSPAWIVVPQCAILRQLPLVMLGNPSKVGNDGSSNRSSLRVGEGDMSQSSEWALLPTAGLAGTILSAREAAEILRSALAAPPGAVHWSTPLASACPPCLRLSLVLSCRNTVLLSLLACSISSSRALSSDDPNVDNQSSEAVSIDLPSLRSVGRTIYSRTLSVVVATLLNHMSESTSLQIMCLRIVAAIVSAHETNNFRAKSGASRNLSMARTTSKRIPPQGSDTAAALTSLVPCSMSAEGWCLSLLLSEVSTSAMSLLFSNEPIQTPGEVFNKTGAFRSTEEKLIAHATKAIIPGMLKGLDFGLGIRRRGAINSFDTNYSNALKAYNAACLVISSAEYEEIYGPLMIFDEKISEPIEVLGQDSERSHSLFELQQRLQRDKMALKLTEQESFKERVQRMALVTWMALMWSIPESGGHHLLSSLAPLRYIPSVSQALSLNQRDEVNAFQNYSQTKLSENEIPLSWSFQRLRFALQLTRTCVSFLSITVFPPSWHVLNMLLISCSMRVHSWVASYLRSCHCGNISDDSQAPSLTTWAPSEPLWRSYIELTLALLTSPLSAPESLRPAHRQAVLERYGDRRSDVCRVLRMSWGGSLTSLAFSGKNNAVTSPGATAIGISISVRALPSTFYLNGPKTGYASTSSTISSNASSLCGSLRVALAPLLVAPSLDLTHCVNSDVSELARDIYLDLIRAELEVHRDRGDAALHALSEIERLTIDAIDILVQQKGPSLVIPRQPGPSAPQPSARARAAFAVSQRIHSPSATSASSSTRSPLSPEVAYTPPSDNLIMSLFAPKVLLRKPGKVLLTHQESVVDTPLNALKRMEEDDPEVLKVEGAFNLAPTTNSDLNDLLSNRTVLTFLSEIRTLYSMLSSVLRFPPTASWEDERAKAALTLIGYLRRTHRSDMYAKYVTFLTDLHTDYGNKAEAALSYLLHADILSWGSQILPPVRVTSIATGETREIFPEQTEAARLEMVLITSARSLAAAQCWEEAVRLGEVLLRRYEYVSAEYSKLGTFLRDQAILYEQIARTQRVFPQYFCVDQAGLGFPKKFRGSFIFRGGPSERIADFEERMLARWPGATKVPMKLSPLNVEDKVSDFSGNDVEPFGNDEDKDDIEEDQTEAIPLAERNRRDISFSSVSVVSETDPFFLILTSDVNLNSDESLFSQGPLSLSPKTPLSKNASLSSSKTILSDSIKSPISSSVLGTRSIGDSLHEQGIMSPLAHAMSVAGTVPQIEQPLSASRINPVLLHVGLGVSQNGNPTLGSEGTIVAPALVRQGREQAGARVFLFQRPFRIKKKNKDGSGASSNDFLDLWVRRYYLLTKHAFPTTHRRSPIVKIREVILNPIESAIAGLNERKITLQDLIERAAAGPDRCAEQSFTQALQGVVDAAVSGGVSNYRPFITGEFRMTHPEIAADIDDPKANKSNLLHDLRCALREQIRVVARGIRVHSVKCSSEMLPLHDFLLSRFDSLRSMMNEWGVLND
jgi:hypothetical protein